jgi:hypothetical protein
LHSKSTTAPDGRGFVDDREGVGLAEGIEVGQRVDNEAQFHNLLPGMLGLLRVHDVWSRKKSAFCCLAISEREESS